jgi:endonuclease YncB( thermonuclease family)
MRKLARLLLTLTLLAACPPVFADVVTGRVVKVSDGDTVTVLSAGNTQHKIRMYGIDAPESDQPFGKKSKEMLSNLIVQKEVRVDITDRDRYGREVGRIYLGNTDINREMLKQGGAWAYRHYLKDPSFIADEEAAKRTKLGLWALAEKERIPPWKWRKDARTPEPAGHDSPQSFRCSGKTLCKQMQSCAEATFYLQECRQKQLDRDGNGVPCEALCR